MDPQTEATHRYRAVFVSDVHLGTRSAKADQLLDFLRKVDCEELYLVGDIVDFWKVRRGPCWTQAHNDCIQKMLRKARKGTRVIYIPGNHDEGLRDYCGQHFGAVEILRDCIHVRADGRRYLVMHGDEFDIIVRYAKWLAFLGDRSYEVALWLNGPLNFIRRHAGLGYWSLSAFLKQRVKGAVNFIGEFEKALSDVARQHGADGIICGHIHTAADRMIDGIHYLNCGDWVESCTAVVETHAGEMRVLKWDTTIEEKRRPVTALASRAAA